MRNKKKNVISSVTCQSLFLLLHKYDDEYKNLLFMESLVGRKNGYKAEARCS